jgi:hypothetical protein
MNYFEDEDIDSDPDFEDRLLQQDNLYDVSEMAESIMEDDTMSMLSAKNPKFIPVDADID